MQAPQGSQRSQQRTAPAGMDYSGPGRQSVPHQQQYTENSPTVMQSDSGVRSSSGSSRSPVSKRSNSAGQQLSQIEKSVTHLLIATKQLLETLTQWSRHHATEAEVSDVYVRLGYEFNIACRAFTAINVETSDLGPVPDLLRGILEETLSQEASSESLDRYLPKIRDIIINLLHGLKRKQQRLRQKQMKEGGFGAGGQSRQASVGSTGSGESSLSHMLADVPSRQQSSRPAYGGREHIMTDDHGVPPRGPSVQGGRMSPIRQQSITSTNGRAPSNRDTQHSLRASDSGSSLSSNTMQNMPVLGPQENERATARANPSSQNGPSFPPPPPPPKQQDALAALQRGGDLERRASRRYSAYQISRHLGASPAGVPVLPPTQNSPVPNRGRDVRESMNAVRARGSQLHSRQRSNNRLVNESSPSRSNNVSHRISEERDPTQDVPVIKPPREPVTDDSPLTKTPEDKLRPSFTEFNGNGEPVVGATLTGPPATRIDELGYSNSPEGDEAHRAQKRSPREVLAGPNGRTDQASTTGEVTSSPPQSQFVAEQSPQPGRELTLFLQYKSKIKKFVLPDGSDLSIARIQLAFIEKFAWNTHSNGNDLPDIYIQDPVSGVRHELEDLADVKERSVLVLNVEVLDEVKRHIDEGIGGLRKMVEGVRTVLDGQQSALARVSDRQQDTAKDIARLSSAPPPASTRSSAVARKISQIDNNLTNGVRSTTPSADGIADQFSEVHGLRRDLAVVRQAHNNFASTIGTIEVQIREKAASVKPLALNSVIPDLEGDTGRAYVNAGKKTLGEDSERIVDRVDNLQDIVEDLRKDVVARGVRPLPRQLDSVGKDISLATAELKKMQEFLKREKPIWTKIWGKELELVCDDREALTLQEELAADLEDDLEKATQTFALVEQATKQQMQQTGHGAIPRSTSRGLSAFATREEVDPVKAQDGVLGEVRALQPNHETRLEAIERAEKARQRELEDRRGGEFQKELGSFVEEGKLKKSGGVEETERMRKAKDDRIRKEVWERQNARAAEKAKEQEAEGHSTADGTAAPETLDVESTPATSESEETQDVETEEQPSMGEQILTGWHSELS
ncbi:MAG: Bud site selection protein 6 [Candelina mexicana]|nr:MAG: Bud site selection protein 6 [Candelina mexicana]